MLLLAFCWRELLGVRGAALLAGAVLGAAPMLARLVTSSGLAVFTEPLAISRGGAPVSLGARLHGAVVVGIPASNGLCDCGPLRAAAGRAYLVLLCAAAALALLALVRSRGGTPVGAGDGRTERVRQTGRLALLAGAALGLLLYVHSNRSGDDPVANARYLTALPVALPAVLWPLWALARRRQPALRAGAVAVLAAAALSAFAATAGAKAWIADGRQSDRAAYELVAALDKAGIRALYSDYKTCGRINFLTRERVRCAVLGDDLRPGQDRYPPIRRAVRAAPDPAYALGVQSLMRAQLDNWLLAHRMVVPVSVAGAYLIYRPAQRLPLAR